MAVSLPNGRNYFTDDAGDPLVGGKVYAFVPGTSTPKDTYTTSAGSVANTHPVVLDSRGEAAIYWVGVYDVVLKTAADVTIWGPERLVEPAPASLEDDLADTSNTSLGDAMIGVNLAATGSVARTQHDKNAEIISVKDFGAVGDGSTNDAAAIQAAIDYAESLIGDVAFSDYGVCVFFPTGKYNCGTTGLTITKGGIALASLGGSRGAVILSDATIAIDIGDYTDAVRLRGNTLRNITLYATDFANTNIGVKVYRCTFTVFDSFVAVNWDIGVDMYRVTSWSMYGAGAIYGSGRTATATAAIRLNGLDETGTTGETYTPGGNGRIIGIEFAGSATTVDTTSGIKFLSCDGLYIVDCHLSGYEKTLDFAPPATAANYVIIDINVVNCYIDNPSSFAANPYCVSLQGTVKETISRSVGTVTSVYRGIRLSNTLIRGANEAIYCYFVRVTDGDSWFDAASQSLEDLIIDGCTLRQSHSMAINISGAATGSFVEPRNLVISNNVFDDNNFSGATGSASDISIQVENATITGNTFGPFANSGADYIILTIVTDSGATDHPAPSVLINGNNLAKCTAPAIDFIRATPGQAGANIRIDGNLLPGTGRDLSESYYLRTTDATATNIWTYDVPQGTGGHVKAVLSGTITDDTGSKHISYTAEVAFRRNAGGTTLSSGGTTWTAGISWNPDAFGTAPVFDISTNTLRVRVTGIAATSIDWDCFIDMHLSR